MLHAHNPELAGEKRRFMIVPPQISREGTKKTMFANITDICRRMHRQPEHVIQFLYAELGNTGAVDGNQRLVMKGRFTQKQIENVLRKYIGEFRTEVSRRAAAALPGMSRINPLTPYSRVRYVQSMQITRYTTWQREPTIFHDL